MWKTIATITTLALALCSAGAPAQAQTGERVLDTLNDLLRGGQQLQGHVVVIHDADIVVQARDGRIYTIATAGVDRSLIARLHPGKPVKVTLKRGSEQAMAAAAIDPLSGEQRSYRTTTGVVDSVSGDRVRLRTDEGALAALDLGQFVGTKPSLNTGDRATVTYDASGQGTLTAVWIEPQPSFGSASPRMTDRPGVTGGGYERIHGFVEAVGLGTFTLKADDGRTVMVDVRNSRGSAGDVRPGDLVNVVGRQRGGDRFVAEVVRKD
jgi:hypothetical protein